MRAILQGGLSRSGSTGSLRSSVTQEELADMVNRRLLDLAFLRVLESNNMQLLMWLCRSVDPAVLTNEEEE